MTGGALSSGLHVLSFLPSYFALMEATCLA
jgi:hypothetical protein